MLLLTVLASFVMFSLVMVLGITVGYVIGYKNEKTLKQQVSKLRQIVKRQNKSAQLRELTVSELKERDDWDFRARLAEIAGKDVANVEQKEIDPNDMSELF